MGDFEFGVITKPHFSRHDARGIFDEVVAAGRWESLVVGRMQPGAVMGHHYHDHTVVLVYLVSGRARIVTVDVQTRERREYTIGPSQGFVFRPSDARTITYEEESAFVLMKSHVYDPRSPDLIPFTVE